MGMALAEENVGLEGELVDTIHYKLRIKMQTDDAILKKNIYRGAKNFFVLKNKLFRRHREELRRIPPAADRLKIMKALHGGVFHWCAENSCKFVMDCFWWPAVGKEVYAYVRSGHGCQFAAPVQKYKTNLRAAILRLFDVLYVDLAGPLMETDVGNEFILEAVEHLTIWLMACPTSNATSETVVEFVGKEIILPFGLLCIIVSNNAMCFTSAQLRDFMD